MKYYMLRKNKLGSKKDKNIIKIIQRRRGMKNNKKGVIIFIIIAIIIVIVAYLSLRYLNSNDEIKEEYTPEEEINDEQLRKTILKLYYIDKQTNEMKTRTKVIDAVELVENPYKKIIELLIADNTEDMYVLPANTRIYDAEINQKIVVLNFSKEILNYASEEEKNNISNILVNTLSELTEVNGVKIKVEGQEVDQYKEIYVRK